MKIQIIKNTKDSLPKGTVIEVEKETKNYYIGFWSSCVGTYKVKVNKNHAEKIK
jgi:hypothetical protein